MEVCENKNRNNDWIRVIVLIVLGVLIAIGGALRVKAAPLGNVITVRTEEVYNNSSFETWNNTKTYSYSYSSSSEDKVKYFALKRNGYDQYSIYVYSFEPVDISVYTTCLLEKNDGSIKETIDYEASYAAGECYRNYTLSNGQKIYLYFAPIYVENSFAQIKYNSNFMCDLYTVNDINAIQQNLEDIIVNGLEPDVEYKIPTEEMDFALVGFECNEYLEASWTGITGISDNVYEDIYVEVVPSYMFMLQEGEQLQEFEKPDTIYVPFLTKAFSNTYEYYFEDNPYVGRAVLTLKFTPFIESGNGNTAVRYRGKTIEVRFDAAGNYNGYDVPIESLEPQYREFVFNNFRVTSLIDGNNTKMLCGWDGFSLDASINYVYRDVKVEMYCYEESTNSWKWLEYPNGALYIGQGRLDLYLKEMADYAVTKGMYFDNKLMMYDYDNSQIRLTPYYKTYTEYIYGKSVLVTTTSMGGIKSYGQSTGDAYNTLYPIYEDLREDYQKDNSVIGDFFDNIINGGDDGEELNLDDVTFNFFTLLKSLLSACGQFPALFAAVFAFLPDYFVSMLVLSFSLIIILRVIGR